MMGAQHKNTEDGERRCAIPPRLSFLWAFQFPRLEWTAAGWGWDSPSGCLAPVCCRNDVGKNEKDVLWVTFCKHKQPRCLENKKLLVLTLLLSHSLTWSSPGCTALCSFHSARRRSHLWGRAYENESACFSVLQSHSATDFPLRRKSCLFSKIPGCWCWKPFVFRPVHIPSTIPQGYSLPLTLCPRASTTVLLPITANGVHSCTHNRAGCFFQWHRAAQEKNVRKCWDKRKGGAGEVSNSCCDCTAIISQEMERKHIHLWPLSIYMSSFRKYQIQKMKSGHCHSVIFVSKNIFQMNLFKLVKIFLQVWWQQLWLLTIKMLLIN